MDRLFDRWGRALSGRRPYRLLAVGAIVAAVVADLLLGGLLVMPGWRARSDLKAQLDEARRELKGAGASRESPEELERRLATARAELRGAADLFLSEPRASEVSDRLDRYADQSGVTIVDIQARPDREESRALYDVTSVHLRVEGTVPRLINFASRVREAALKGFTVTGVNVEESQDLSTLTMNITLYSSPYSRGAAEREAEADVPTVTPIALTQMEESLAAAWKASDWRQVISLIRQMRAVDPRYDELTEKLYAAHVNYGYQLLRWGDTGGAAAQFDLALGVKADGPEALAGLHRAMATPTPTLTPAEQLAQRLHTLWGAGNWEEVVSLVERILRMRPGDEEMMGKLYAAHVNQGYALAAEGRLEEAKGEFIRALDINPHGGEAVAGLRELADRALPRIPPPGPKETDTVYVVRRGDTLFSIARRHGTTVEAIKAANGLTSDDIHAGLRLQIPP